MQEAVKDTELYLAENFGGRKLPVGRAKGPWPTEYLAETDVTLELNRRPSSLSIASRCTALDC